MSNVNQHTTLFTPFTLLDRRRRYFLFFMLFLGLARSLRENNPRPYDVKRTFHCILSIADGIDIPVICSQGAEKYYQQYPNTYQKNMEKLSQTMSVMVKQPEMYCKMAAIVQYAQFKIEVTTSKELQQEEVAISQEGSKSFYPATMIMVAALYDFQKSHLILPMEEINQDLSGLLYHESHHAYITRRNEENKIHEQLRVHVPEHGVTLRINSPSLLDSTDKDLMPKWLEKLKAKYPSIKESDIYWMPFVCTKAEEKKLCGVFKNVYNKFIDYILTCDLLSDDTGQKSSTPHFPLIMYNDDYLLKRASHLSNKTLPMNKDTIQEWLNITQEYVPKMISFPRSKEDVKQLVSQRLLDEQYRVTKIFPFLIFGVKIYVSSAEINPENSNEIRFYGRTVASLSPEDRMKAAFLDGYYFFIHVSGLYYNDDLSSLLTELDAYLHEVYEPYPTVFRRMLPELIAYHQPMDAAILKKFSPRFFNQKKESHENHTRTENLIPEIEGQNKNNTIKLNSTHS